VEDVLASRMIADPFHLLDCSITSEGGAAVVLTSTARAADLDAPSIRILGGALERMGQGYTTAPEWDRHGRVGAMAARHAFGQAGLTPNDVDFCELYDPFSFEIIRQLEVFGFCAEGEGGPFIEGGRLALDGALPTCTDGGTLSFSHPGSAQMLQKVVAAADQIRGRAGERQLDAPGIGLVTNGGAGALFTDVLLLGAGR
jgi:acetyl-CoA acetyltransferase